MAGRQRNSVLDRAVMHFLPGNYMAEKQHIYYKNSGNPSTVRSHIIAIIENMKIIA